MNDTAIKNYCMWARRELIAGVQAKAHYYGIREDGYEPAAAEVLHGEVVLTPEERKQREGLIQLYESKDKNYEALIEQAAYTWFNRIMAIRFMELNDRLPSHTRMFSFNDGSFGSQAVKEALDIQIEGVDQARVIEYKQASDDEALFRYLFLAQCNELSTCMPQVFDPVGSALELLLPDGLLRRSSVIERMVADIPEEDWREGVEIVGWMYQYYNAERKDEVFASFKKGKKADKESIAPATQLFTPHWIVQYLTENSLGRLWMLNHPNSKLVDQMKYYLAPDEESHEVPQKVESPEEITICDPACGSGHILVYAFDLLAAMYEEAGYSHRDIPRLVLENNLTGFEIDPRAAEMASFALTMKGCEWDRRFLRRNVQPEIVVLQSVVFEPEELDLFPELVGEKKLLDTLAHLSECGSLFLPADEEVAVLRQSLEKLQAGASLFSGKAEEKLSQAIYLCEQLQRKFSVTIANPPYMGLKRLSSWYVSWLKSNYKIAYFDLYASFIMMSFLRSLSGYIAIVSMFTWATDKSFLKLREYLINTKQIICLLHMEATVMPIAFETSATVFSSCNYRIKGCYSGINPADMLKGIPRESAFSSNRSKLLSIDLFNCIPEKVFAYWVSDSMREAFTNDQTIGECVMPRVGIQTGDTERFLRSWWEIDTNRQLIPDGSNRAYYRNNYRWIPYNNAGDYCKWYGNNQTVLKWENEGEELINSAQIENRKIMTLPKQFRYKPMVSWNDYGLGQAAFRYSPAGYLFDVIEPAFIDVDMDQKSDLFRILAFCNSSVADAFISLLMPGRHKNIGKMAQLPWKEAIDYREKILRLASCNIEISKENWDSLETSWEFKRHPLLRRQDMNEKELEEFGSVEFVESNNTHIGVELTDNGWLLRFWFVIAEAGLKLMRAMLGEDGLWYAEMSCLKLMDANGELIELDADGTERANKPICITKELEKNNNTFISVVKVLTKNSHPNMAPYKISFDFKIKQRESKRQHFEFQYKNSNWVSV